MNCNKCNAELEQDAVICANCEESAQEQTVQSDFEEAIAQDLNEEPVAAVHEPAQSEPQKAPKKAGWKIIVPLAIAAFAIGYFAATTLFSPSTVSTALSVGAAFENFGDELGERIENSPFAAVMLLEDILDDGSLTVDFVHGSGQGFGMFDTRGSVTMLSHVETDESAFLIDVSIGGFLNVDLDIFLNTERLAARSNMLGSTAYGITFDTFRDDIRAFGPLIGLDNATMDELSDFVEAFTESLDNPMFTDPEEYIAPYIELITKFALGWDMQSRDDQLAVCDANIDVTVVTITITDSDLAEFLTGLHALLKDDEALRSYINLQDSIQGFNGSGSMYDEFLGVIQDIIDQVDQTVSGQITVEMAISNDNRLINSTKTVDLDIDGTPIRVTAVMDLGLSIHDPWTLDFFIDDDAFNITWTFPQLDGRFENKLSFGDASETIASLASEWFPETGNFTLSYEDYQNRNSGSFSGVLILDDDGGFDLRFDENIDIGGGESIAIGISGAVGANIEQIEYINLDQWDTDLIETLFGLMNLF